MPGHRLQDLHLHALLSPGVDVETERGELPCGGVGRRQEHDVQEPPRDVRGHRLPGVLQEHQAGDGANASLERGIGKLGEVREERPEAGHLWAGRTGPAHQVSHLERVAPPAAPVVEEERHHPRKPRAWERGVLALPDGHHVAQHLERDPLVRVRLVLEQDEDQERSVRLPIGSWPAAVPGRADPVARRRRHPQEEIGLVGPQRRIHEGSRLDGDLRAVEQRGVTGGQERHRQFAGRLRVAEGSTEERVVRRVLGRAAHRPE